MVDFFIQYQVQFGILATLVTLGGAGFAVIRWLIIRKTPIRIEVANPEALAPPPRANLIEMTQREFIALTKEWRDQAYAERDKVHGAERAALEDKIADLYRQLANPEEAQAQLHAQILRLEETLDGLGNNISSDRITAAKTAMEQGDFSLADAIFVEVEAREEIAVQNTARAAFGRGEVAEAEVRWPDAATHYARAARLNPTFETLTKACRFALRGGDYHAAFRLGETLLALARSAGTPERLAHAMNEHALTLDAQGLHAKAEELFRQALAFNEETHSETQSDKTATLNNLARSIQAQGRLAEAEWLLRQALEIDRATLGESHPSYAIRLNNLASVVDSQGRHAEAEVLARKAIKITRATRGEMHPDYAARLNSLACAVQAQGRYVEAEGLIRQALKITHAALGVAHPHYAVCISNLATVVGALGRHAEAEELGTQALKITRETLGDAHPDYAIRLNNLAQAVLQQGRHAEAEELCSQALEITRTTLGELHPDYSKRLNSLAGTVDEQGRYAEAEGLYARALESGRQTLGDAHPHTQLVARNLLSLITDHLPASSHKPVVSEVLAAAPDVPPA